MQGKTHKALGATVGTGLIIYDIKHGTNITAVASTVTLTLGSIITSNSVKKKHKDYNTILAGVGVTLAGLFMLAITLANDSIVIPFSLGFLPAVFGAMLPDIDHHATKLGKTRIKVVKSIKTLVMLAVLVIMGILIYSSFMQDTLIQTLVFLGIIWVVILFIYSIVKSEAIQKRLGFYEKHRGIMHTLLIPTLCFVMYFVAFQDKLIAPLTIGLALGYLSHLVADLCTEMGTPILWPISQKLISIMPITTGTALEYIMAVMLGGLFICLALIL